jgi:hypothetical protein
MDRATLDGISRKLSKIIQQKDIQQVRHWAKIIDRQRDPMIAVQLFILIRRQLHQLDAELDRWFQDIYFEDTSPELRKMWLEFVDLCSLSLE